MTDNEPQELGFLGKVFLRDDRTFKSEVHAAVDREDLDSEELGWHLEAALKEHKVALNGSKFTHHIQKLVLSNNRQRAHKLVDVLNDFDVRAWVRVLFFVVKKSLWVALAVGVVWAGVAMYHCSQ
jgi:hypothetical protein